MEVFGFHLSTVEIAVFSAGAGVAVATLSLLLNMLVEALKSVSERAARPGGRRCTACGDPAEPGSTLCHKHAQLSAMVQRRRA